MKDGVGQLAWTFCFPEEPPEPRPKDDTQETEANGSEASRQPPAVESQPARKRKWHSLIDKVYVLRNLQSAWERVRANGGAPGIDGMTVTKFAEQAETRL